MNGDFKTYILTLLKFKKRTIEDEDMYEISEKLARVYIKQARLRKKEKDLLRQLMTAKKPSGVTLTLIKGSNWSKTIDVAGTSCKTFEEDLNNREDGNHYGSEALYKNEDERAKRRIYNKHICPNKNKTDRFGAKLKVGD